MTENTPKKTLYTFGNDIVVPKPVEEVQRGKDMVTFGETNQYPQFLFGLYSDCSLLQSLVNGTSQYISGNGFTNDELDSIVVNPSGETLYDLSQKISLDYILFGAFSVQVRRNAFGDIVSLDYVDVQKVRLSDDGKTVYYNSKWERYAKDIKTYKRFNPKEKYDNSILYWKNPLGRGIYGLPIWSSAIKEVQTLTEISTFHLASIKNGLHSPMAINFNNGVPTDEEQREIEELINEKFSGSSNAGKFLLSFNESKENSMTIDSVPDENYDQKYLSLKTTSTESLMTAFRANAQLFGVDSQQTGFSNIEYKSAFALFNTTVVKPIQRQIQQAFAMLGYEVEFNQFEVDFEEGTDADAE